MDVRLFVVSGKILERGPKRELALLILPLNIGPIVVFFLVNDFETRKSPPKRWATWPSILTATSKGPLFGPWSNCAPGMSEKAFLAALSGERFDVNSRRTQNSLRGSGRKDPPPPLHWGRVGPTPPPDSLP